MGSKIHQSGMRLAFWGSPELLFIRSRAKGYKVSDVVVCPCSTILQPAGLAAAGVAICLPDAADPPAMRPPTGSCLHSSSSFPALALALLSAPPPYTVSRTLFAKGAPH